MQKDFDEWNKKKCLENTVFSDYVNTREVWWCSLGLNLGFEQDGRNELFERPVLVVQKFSKDIVLVIPFTSTFFIYAFFVHLAIVTSKGEPIKIEEYVPTAIPMRSASTKS
jgi:mRNA interferase MazF